MDMDINLAYALCDQIRSQPVVVVFIKESKRTTYHDGKKYWVISTASTVYEVKKIECVSFDEVAEAIHKLTEIDIPKEYRKTVINLLNQLP